MKKQKQKKSKYLGEAILIRFKSNSLDELACFRNDIFEAIHEVIGGYERFDNDSFFKSYIVCPDEEKLSTLLDEQDRL